MIWNNVAFLSSILYRQNVKNMASNLYETGNFSDGQVLMCLHFADDTVIFALNKEDLAYKVYKLNPFAVA